MQITQITTLSEKKFLEFLKNTYPLENARKNAKKAELTICIDIIICLQNSTMKILQ